MTFVMAASCVMCKYTHCVDVYPTDAFRGGPDFRAIEPDDYIDCTFDVAKCSVVAIFEGCAVPHDQTLFIALNVELTRGWRSIIEMKIVLPMPPNGRRSGTKSAYLHPGELSP
jgi:ferredoxin